MKVIKEPIIIEQLPEEKLTKKDRKLMEEALEDLKRDRKEKFVSLEELRKIH